MVSLTLRGPSLSPVGPGLVAAEAAGDAPAGDEPAGDEPAGDAPSEEGCCGSPGDGNGDPGTAPDGQPAGGATAAADGNAGPADGRAAPGTTGAGGSPGRCGWDNGNTGPLPGPGAGRAGAGRVGAGWVTDAATAGPAGGGCVAGLPGDFGADGAGGTDDGAGGTDDGGPGRAGDCRTVSLAPTAGGAVGGGAVGGSDVTIGMVMARVGALAEAALTSAEASLPPDAAPGFAPVLAPGACGPPTEVVTVGRSAS